MFQFLFDFPLVLLLLLPSHIVAIGYSYSRFEGPVGGSEQKIFVPDVFGQGSRIDFVAKPEYNFAYGVEDGKTRVLHNRKERRDGDEVVGVYSVVDPDGTLRIVKYTADNVNGFQAKVIKNGVTTLYGHNNGVDEYVEAMKQQEQYSATDDSVESKDKMPYKVHDDYAEDDSEETFSNNDGSEDEQEMYDESSEEGYDETVKLNTK